MHNIVNIEIGFKDLKVINLNNNGWYNLLKLILTVRDTWGFRDFTRTKTLVLS